ncbi:Uma2 family endonuclease [Streptomyces griseoaurantiacus]|uniref:Endonuclease, Uma2 family (Restriction endonuclease fold) n=1 Tax=Streptomyces griseoaurantiacus TaxID=68213 RepID=A0A1G7NM35_9ACTN|nr:Uma2 family endonuclease [Streptomyces jietaisiensis]SDF74359.1 Endonuclease, Uma2 family (restriction endonuclease fold) [Streptomyces jietaisiensis]
MTRSTAAHPQMSVEDFEELAKAAPEGVRLEFINGRVHAKDGLSVEDFEELERRAPETVRLEYAHGKLEVKPMPDGNHRSILMWLLRQCMQHRPDLDLVPESGIKAEAYRKGRARADATLTPVDHFVGHGEWSTTDGVLMAVEITSHDRDTDRRDRIDKPVGYAEAEIPVYLLIDRDHHTVVVHSEPKDGRYRQTPSYPWGATVELPPPVGITLDTEQLKKYAD